jgi:membrane-bound lytic murein transglycosylase D
MLLSRPFGASFAAAVLFTLAACAPSARNLPSGPSPVVTEPEALGDGPEIADEELPTLARDILGSAVYDLPVEANTWVEAELDFLVGERHAVIGRWIERADFYEEYVKATLAQYGLPTDLHHLAMIESGYLPTVRSRAGAVGMWQFMPATGRQMGLRVDSLVDERMDPVRSTHAAARHLRWLRGSLGDWALAAAAYNAGSGRITRGLQSAGASNFWELAVWGDLADETKHYVPRLYAMTIIGRDRTRFGFAERDMQRAGFAYDSMQVDYATPLSELAQIGGIPVEQLTRLNPHLVKMTTPPGSYWVWVPAETGHLVQEAYLASDFRKQKGYGVYTVRRGDSLGEIADLSGIAASRIRELNPKVDWDRLQVGRKLTLPHLAAQSLASRPETRAEPKKHAAAEAPPRNKETTTKASEPAAAKTADGAFAEHVVEQGETLWSIARRYAVNVSAIQEANTLSGSIIVPGKALRIPRQKQEKIAPEAKSAVTAAAGSGSAVKGKGADDGKADTKTARHIVKSGDTLWGIAREYGSSVEAIQGANSMADGVITPGQKLLIPR